MAGNETPTPRSWLTEGLIIAFLPALAYLMAFSYETGFLKAYNIPSDFVEVNLNTICTFFFAIIVVGSVLLNIFLAILIITPAKYKRFFKKLIPILIYFFLVLIYVATYPLQMKKWSIMIIFLAFFLFIIFGMPLITQRNKKTYLEKVEAHEERDTQLLSTTLLHSFRQSIFPNILVIVGYIFLFISLSNVIGEFKAINKKDYIIIKGMPEIVVLRAYEDQLICSHFDRNTKQIDKKFFVVEKKSTSVEYHQENIGPLYIMK